jgi:prevent-host-death family protein
MNKKITTSELRNRLGNLLDQLEDGHSHFIVERNSREVAVLLSMEKFQEIMATLETLQNLELIEEQPARPREPQFPVLEVLGRKLPEVAAKNGHVPAADNAKDAAASPSPAKDAAARLGIGIVK